MRYRYINKNKIKDITPEDLSQLKTIVFTKYFDGLKRSDTKMSTIEQKIKNLNSFFSYLVYNDYIEKDYIKGIPKNKYKLKNKQKVKEK